MTYHLPHRWPQEEAENDERAKNKATVKRIIEDKEARKMAFKQLRKEHRECLTSNI